MMNVLRHPSSLVDKDAAAQPRAVLMDGSLVPLLLTSTHLLREACGIPLPDLNLPSGICRRIHIYL